MNVKVTTNCPSTLKLKAAGKARQFGLARGGSEFTFDGILMGLTSVATIHRGLVGQNFGEANSEKRLQAFIAPIGGDLRGIDFKLQKEGGHSQSEITVEMFATKSGKPMDKSLAKAMVKATDVELFLAFYTLIYATNILKR